ncbi:MAG TPA: glycosyltransferase family 4 protein [Tepidisphaeraceae bacterium]|jgi:glycosyltransferase involved in cell wall biosynthesis|nr:glycosyltransferase family 4 protein [Tepidisphaeraceae bacterium]
MNDSRFRVLLLTDADMFAGTERHMLDLAVGLRDVGILPAVGCPTQSPIAERAEKVGVPVVGIKKSALRDWNAVRTLVGLLNADLIDVIHSHNGRTALSGAIATTIANRGVLVATQHFLKPSRDSRSGVKRAVSSCLHRWIGRRAPRHIAISDAVRQEMIARGDIAADKIVTIRNAVREIEPSRKPSRKDARRGLGLPNDTPLVFCAARLDPEKNVRSLVRAMALVIQKLPAAFCLIAGEGSERIRLEQEIESLGLTSHVQLLGFQTRMNDLFAACDIFVLPSLAEPFGLVLLEAMSHGRAVIATNAGGPLEIVADGETGLLVPSDNCERLASAILHLLADDMLSTTMGCNGSKRLHEMFTLTRMARETVSVYEQAITIDRHARNSPKLDREHSPIAN